MNCSDFQQLIAERVAEELSAELKREMELHEQSCAACRQAVASWEQVRSLLRASWPDEEPRAPFVIPIPPRPVGWLETARTWMSWASTAIVAGCLLLLVVLRPSVGVGGGQLSINFSHRPAEQGIVSAQAVTPAQVQNWVQQAVAQAGTQQSAKGEMAPRMNGIPANDEEARRVAQLAVQLEMLKLNQDTLWQQVEQHGLYLQSAWRGPADDPGVHPKQNTDRP